MAEKKYLDLTALNYYDGKIKAHIEAKDAAALAVAKKYADDLAVNYDAAGTAQTKVNELANGAVKLNTEAIAVLNGEGAGSVKKAVADLKTVLDGDIDAVEAKADAAQAAADAAQGEVDALETLVGVLPEGATAKSVVEYVNEKTAGIATDAALTELTGRVTTAEGAIDAIEADYLKAADKTALQDQITENAGAIAGVVADYLKAADKTELQGKIDLKADASALEAEIARAKAAEEKNAADIALILNNPDTDVVDSINEFITYVAEHGEVATGLQTQITENADAISGLSQTMGDINSNLGLRLETLEAIDHDAYVGADTALENKLNGEIAKKADQSVVDAMDGAYKAADTALDNRLKAVEASVGETGSVATAISTAKQEAIDAAVGTAAADATSKANTAEANAKAYADAEIDKVEENVSKNASDIAGVAGRMTTAEGEIDALQAAVGDVENVAAAVADAKKAGTDAQAYAEGVNTAVTNLTTRVGTNESGLSAHGDRLTALETKVGDGFVAITNAEIDAMFAQ